jgi:hypothetical protein
MFPQIKNLIEEITQKKYIVKKPIMAMIFSALKQAYT